jgi:hypothetical protein
LRIRTAIHSIPVKFFVLTCAPSLPAPSNSLQYSKHFHALHVISLPDRIHTHPSSTGYKRMEGRSENFRKLVFSNPTTSSNLYEKKKTQTHTSIMLPSNIIALFALVAAPMLAVAYPTSQGSEELILRALADEPSIAARYIAEAMVDILERRTLREDLVRRAPPNGECVVSHVLRLFLHVLFHILYSCSTASPQRKTGPACANAGGFGWMSGGRCYSRQQMALQGNVMQGNCYY